MEDSWAWAMRETEFGSGGCRVGESNGEGGQTIVTEQLKMQKEVKEL